MTVEDLALRKAKHHNADGSRPKRPRENSNTRSICPVDWIVCLGLLKVPRLLITVPSGVLS